MDVVVRATVRWTDDLRERICSRIDLLQGIVHLHGLPLTHGYHRTNEAPQEHAAGRRSGAGLLYHFDQETVQMVTTDETDLQSDFHPTEDIAQDRQVEAPEGPDPRPIYPMVAHLLQGVLA